MIINNTAEFFDELTAATLSNSGWEVEKKSGYVIASREDQKRDLIICTVGRCLSNVNTKETPMVIAKIGKVEKMLRYLDTIPNDCVACISYGVAKFSMNDFELTIVPVDVMRENAKRGGVYSTTDRGFFYNYTQLEDFEVPTGAIMRKCWKAI